MARISVRARLQSGTAGLERARSRLGDSEAIIASLPASTRPFATAVSGRAIALIAIVLIAYNYSLATLVRGLSLQTPLAYLAFVPLIALILGWVRLAREPAGLPIHDRQLDYIIGIGFLALAGAIVLFAPTTLETRFWLMRVDLLSLPPFVAGLVALFYGVRRLWTLRFPIAFLFLAWPLVYAPVVGDLTDRFTEATGAAVALISRVLPFATPAPGSETDFFIGKGATAFVVSIGSACAGVNSLVGFALVGGALAYVVRGSWQRRFLWLMTGLAIIWVLNIVRIEGIFVVGSLFGRAAALDVLHPVAGLLVFNAGVLAMLWAVPRMGLTFVAISPDPDGPLLTPSPVRRVRAALVLGISLGLMASVVNAGYSRYEQIASPTGEARLVPFDINEAQVTGWESGFMAANPTANQYFGANATWNRLLYSPLPGARLQTSVPVYVDVISTDNPGALAAYGLEACYTFHGYRIESSSTVDIGAGTTAGMIDYHNAALNADWSALWWEWPFQKDGRTWYERIVIFLASGPRAQYAGVATDVPPAASERFTGTDRFLAALAREIVRSQIHQVAAIR